MLIKDILGTIFIKAQCIKPFRVFLFSFGGFDNRSFASNSVNVFDHKIKLPFCSLPKLP